MSIARMQRTPQCGTRLPFTLEKLNPLFKDLAFEVRRKTHTLATARPWVMAAALFSGMREREICDLDAENVRERHGVPYFDVTRAKSKAGVRLIPVHSELLKLGFLDYVASIGQGPLLPGIAVGSRGQGRAHTFAKRFPAYRRQRGVTRDRLAFHSFCKCFVRALELAAIDRDRAALVIGHERGFACKLKLSGHGARRSFVVFAFCIFGRRLASTPEPIEADFVPRGGGSARPDCNRGRRWPCLTSGRGCAACS